MIQQLISKLCEELELNIPAPEEDGSYILSINSLDKLNFRPLEPGFSIQAQIVTFPEERKEVALMHLMKANFLGSGTGGSVISLDSEEKYLTLSHHLPYEVNYKVFKERVEEFVNYLNYWREQMEDGEIFTS